MASFVRSKIFERIGHETDSLRNCSIERVGRGKLHIVKRVHVTLAAKYTILVSWERFKEGHRK